MAILRYHRLRRGLLVAGAHAVNAQFSDMDKDEINLGNASDGIHVVHCSLLRCDRGRR